MVASTRQRWICGGCGEFSRSYPATSRVDNQTKLCSQCGTFEALADLGREPLVAPGRVSRDGREINWREHARAQTDPHACICGARYDAEVSTEYVAYRRYGDHGREERNADTFSDGEIVIWDCPFCGRTERRP